MLESKITDRLAFLAEKFDVFNADENGLKSKVSELEAAGNVILNQCKVNNKILALLWGKKEAKMHMLGMHEMHGIQSSNVSISMDIFSDMIAADPTPNKSCVQWMLNVFTRYLKKGDGESMASAIRFADEDLPLANSYLSLFEANKRKNKFMRLCQSSPILEKIEDPTDINQYRSLSQLYDAIDPFIEREPSEVERLLLKFVASKEALIPVRDRKFTLFIPLSTDASVVFDKFASWCTAKAGNGMFTSYTNHLKPNGEKSNLYIIIDNRFFAGETKDVYQIHFETHQLKDRSNSQADDFFERVLSESEALSNYFQKELIAMAKTCKGGLDKNMYLDYLVKFGFCESLFELIDTDTPEIKFMTREIPKLPDISRFQAVEQLIITGAKLHELHPSVGKLKNLQMLILTANKIKHLPSEIGYLKNMTFMNLKENPIETIPDEIRFLDPTNGGNLFRLAVSKDEIGEANYKKLRQLLPSVSF